MIGTFLAITATLLVVSLSFNVYLLLSRRSFEEGWLARETRALDRAHAAEIRAGQQVDAMLDRFARDPHAEIVAKLPDAIVNPEEHKAWFDDEDPVDQERWNEYHGEPAEATS